MCGTPLCDDHLTKPLRHTTQVHTQGEQCMMVTGRFPCSHTQPQTAAQLPPEDHTARMPKKQSLPAHNHITKLPQR